MAVNNPPPLQNPTDAPVCDFYMQCTGGFPICMIFSELSCGAVQSIPVKIDKNGAKP